MTMTREVVESNHVQTFTNGQVFYLPWRSSGRTLAMMLCANLSPSRSKEFTWTTARLLLLDCISFITTLACIHSWIRSKIMQKSTNFLYTAHALCKQYVLITLNKLFETDIYPYSHIHQI